MNRMLCAFMLLLISFPLSFAQLQAAQITLEEQYMEVEPVEGESGGQSTSGIVASSAQDLQMASVDQWTSGAISDIAVLEDIDALTQKPGQPPPVPDMRSAAAQPKVCTLKTHIPGYAFEYYDDVFGSRQNAYMDYYHTYVAMYNGNKNDIKSYYGQVVEDEMRSFIGQADFDAAYDLGAVEEGESQFDVVMGLVKAVYGPTVKDFVIKDYLITNKLFGIGFVIVGAPAGFLLSFDDVLQATAYLMHETLDSIMEWYANVQDVTNISLCYGNLMASRHYYHVYNETPGQGWFGYYSLSEMTALAAADKNDLSCMKQKADSDGLASWQCEDSFVKRLGKEYELLKYQPDGIIQIGGWEAYDWEFGLGSACVIPYVQNLMQPVLQGLKSYGEADAGRLGNMYVRYSMDVCLEPSEVQYSTPIVGRYFEIKVPVKNIGHGEAKKVRAYVYDSNGNLLGQSTTTLLPAPAGAPSGGVLTVVIDSNKFQPRAYTLTLIVTGEQTWTGPKGTTLSSGYDFFNENNVYNISLTFSNYPPAEFETWVSDVTDTKATVAWDECQDVDFKEYHVYRTNATGGGRTLFYNITDKAKTTAEFIDLNPGVDRYYQVSAVDKFGAARFSTVVHARTLEGTRAQITQPQKIDHDSVPLQWNRVWNEFFESYVVCVSQNHISYDGIRSRCSVPVAFITDPARTNYTVTGLMPSTTYYFMVMAAYNVSATGHYYLVKPDDYDVVDVSAKTNASEGPYAAAWGPGYVKPFEVLVGEKFYVYANKSVGKDYPLAQYAWNFNGGAYDFIGNWSAVKPVQWSEAKEGTYIYTLMVNDTVGRKDLDSLTAYVYNPQYAITYFKLPEEKMVENGAPGVIRVDVEYLAPYPITANASVRFYDNATEFANVSWSWGGSRTIYVNWTPHSEGMHNITAKIVCALDLHPENKQKSAEKYVIMAFRPDAGIESLSVKPDDIRQYDTYDAYAVMRVVGDISPPKGVFRTRNKIGWEEGTVASDAPYQQWITLNLTGLDRENSTVGAAPVGSPAGGVASGAGANFRESTLYDEIMKERGGSEMNTSFNVDDTLTGSSANGTGAGIIGGPGAGMKSQLYSPVPESYKKIPVKWWVYHKHLTTVNEGWDAFEFILDPDHVLEESNEDNNEGIFSFQPGAPRTSIDLYIESISFTKDLGGVGQHLISVVIKNGGRNFSGYFRFDVRLGSVNGSSINGEQAHSGIAGGESYSYLKGGAPEKVTEQDLADNGYIICAVIDMEKRVDETNRNNNWKCADGYYYYGPLAPEEPPEEPATPPANETPYYPPYNTSGG
ncbi:Uncharacterised protein [Candidatus Burarchaeum australiense]|nr:Uncharacterised protein [Candidatus Burarchaeum australiense]